MKVEGVRRMEEKEVPYVRILLKNIQFSDSYEQQKFERLKSESNQKAIKRLEKLLAHQKFIISFE